MESWKSQTWWSLPVYTGDVSGVCSALYELGGMVVMHDPSGCNSTYNTHDEIRWASMESLVFLSGLTQIDAITGNDRKLIDDIVSASAKFHPAFIAVANSPVPWLIGTDFEAVCRKVQEKTGIPAFHVETNAMHDYTRGAGLAFLELAKMLFSGKVRPDPGRPQTESGQACKPGRPQDRILVNVLGMTPLDFTVRNDVRTLRRLLEENGFEVVSVWAMQDSLEQLKCALEADVSLVVSSAGIDTARWMEETFGIPYTAGIPTGAFSDILFDALRTCARRKKSGAAYLKVLKDQNRAAGKLTQNAPCTRCIAGEPVTMGSVAADRVLRSRERYDLIPLTETWRGLALEDAPHPAGERQIREVLAGYEEVTADPMLKGACRNGCRFLELPHFALSGRVYLDRIRPLIT